MEKNNLDNFFAEKLSQRKFEFDPAHWEAAEKLIELQEQDNQNKRYGWWLLLIPLIGLIGCLCYFAKADIKADQSATSAVNQSGMTQSSLNFVDKHPIDNQTKAVIPTESKTSDKPDSSNTNSQTQTNKGIETKTTVNDFSTSSTTDKVEMKNATEPAFPKSLNSTFPKTQENNNSTVTEIPATVKASSGVETITEEINRKTVPSEFNGKRLQLMTPDTTSQNIKQIKTPKLDQASITPVESAIDLTKEPVVSTPDEAVATSNVLLDIPALVASIDDVADSEKGIMIKKDRKKKFDIGLMAGTLFYSTKSEATPSDDSSLLIDTTVSSSGAYRLGFTGGLTVGFRISNHFSLHADALYQWRKEDLGVISSTRGEAFSFGRVATTTETQPQSFHSIEIPIYLQYSYNGHSLEAGVSCRHLFAIQGIDKSEGAPELPEANTVELADGELLSYGQNEVWIPEDKYQRFTASYMVGYRYWFNDRFNLGLRATYTPSAKPANSNFSVEDTQTYSTQTNSLNFGLTAKWYFNKRSKYQKI